MAEATAGEARSREQPGRPAHGRRTRAGPGGRPPTGRTTRSANTARAARTVTGCDSSVEPNP
ncbi:MAG TPA: hypothetical protein VE546_09835 [Streptomyces sp.]|uniref:hypothetical protein n=1 Tax=Streptomyces sp. TaxID=1931 RepID=UPI002D55C195|nr:hypothetical protein [Streptomyces sp.]HZG03862.1 hypothetical protein [Streptomyces sp.]